MSCRIITGGKGAGKTSLMRTISIEKDVRQGFLSLRTGNGYSLLDLSNGTEHPFISEDPSAGSGRIGRWYYDEEAFREACRSLVSYRSGTVCIDEIGRLELSGEGFAPALKALAADDCVDLILSVRTEYLDAVIDCFCLRSVSVQSVEA